MRSKNPVFTRGDGLRSGAAPSPAYLQSMYDAPSASGMAPTDGSAAGARMTVDDVVARTAMTIGVLAVSAAATWYLATPSIVTTLVPALIALGIGLFISFKHVTSAAPILIYAAIQGVFIGSLSEMMNAIVAVATGGTATNVVVPAVGATLCVAAVMLALYKFRVIRVTPKFTKFLIAATAGFLLFSLFDLVLGLFGLGIGWNGLGTWGLISSLIGAGLAALMLMLDFDYVERAVADGAPQSESWFAAFGLTVTLVWLYVEILRLVTIFSSGD